MKICKPSLLMSIEEEISGQRGGGEWRGCVFRHQPAAATALKAPARTFGVKPGSGFPLRLTFYKNFDSAKTGNLVKVTACLNQNPAQGTALISTQ